MGGAKRKKLYLALAAAALMALCLCGCAPSREELAEAGIYTLEYADELLASKIEEAALSGNTAFELNYYGKRADIPDLAAGGWRKGYVNARFVKNVSAEYEQYRGYVIASYSLSLEDAEALAALPTENGAFAAGEFSSEALEAALLDMMQTRREKGVFAYQKHGDIASFDKAVYAAVSEIQERSYACEYMTERLSWVASDYDDVAELELTAQYREDALPLGELMAVSTRAQLVDSVSAGWNAREPRIVLLLDGLELSEDALMELLNEAESNCSAMPCEAEKIWTEQYKKQDGKQILRMWAEYAVGDDALDAMWRELNADILRRAGEIISNGAATDRELYRAAFDQVRSACRYDMDLYDATLEKNLDADTRIGRTAYGALINGKTVCTGYARAFKALCDELGLACRIVTGEHEGVGHAWNVVQIDGETRYVDCSFADTGGGSDYFLFGSRLLNSSGYKMNEYSVIDW